MLEEVVNILTVVSLYSGNNTMYDTIQYVKFIIFQRDLLAVFLNL